MRDAQRRLDTAREAATNSTCSKPLVCIPPTITCEFRDDKGADAPTTQVETTTVQTTTTFETFALDYCARKYGLCSKHDVLVLPIVREFFSASVDSTPFTYDRRKNRLTRCCENNRPSKHFLYMSVEFARMEVRGAEIIGGTPTPCFAVPPV
ncbi:unnamed protein product [Cylicocyclus nassatus]|uniref:Uncharacterized protein n=1 Tax=Cylicocyclus nassatus TaxID=53992 RepID=A0AA36GCV4_CYLNA|nr:unnamed protein product [Cylicocyclus nassatus]